MRAESTPWHGHDGCSSPLLISSTERPLLLVYGVQRQFLWCREWRRIADDVSLWRDLHASNPAPMLSFPQPLKGSQYSPESSRLRTNSPHMRTGAELKCLYRCSEAWRTGNGDVRLVSVPGGSGNASALQIAPGVLQIVIASGSRGSCTVVDLQTGRQLYGVGVPGSKESQDPSNDDLDGLYSCAAISGDCQTVGFGSFDGLVSIHDVKSGKRRAMLSGAQHRAVVLTMALSWDGAIVAAGLSDGHLALGHLSKHGGQRKSDAVDSPHWSLHLVGSNVGITCLEANTGDASGACSRNSLVVGTSGGHVKVINGESGKEEAALVGGCSCPVTCLCLASPDQGWSSLVYGGFSHHTIGNGHSNSVYVWDVRSACRVARLHLSGAGGGQRQRRQGRGTPSGAASKSICADPYKVVVTAGKGATVFETRTWQPLYEMRFSQTSGEEVSEAAEEEEEEGGGADREEWFWSMAAKQGGDVGTNVTAESVMMCCFSLRQEGSEDYPRRSILDQADVSRRVNRRQHSVERVGYGGTNCGTSEADASGGKVAQEALKNRNESQMLAPGARGLTRTKSDGDLGENKGGMRTSSSGSLNGVEDEPAGKGLHFVGTHLVVRLKSGRVGIVDFGGDQHPHLKVGMDVRRFEEV